ncbi:DUF4240 domain-containing protein [Bailinhaonella thermotolerans]|uniref:DUF4240 domain-containing protein n=1 Tax=Bailinhaonella thermotolerans TaxID=1070861 RepID=A0A3A4A4B7_9ACTN|nr:DUF4240 domain-containing protein [Bailinhaonella thermotolerans]RJL22566.1 DUF4240 domain-containing protein [Bailinhaonella thermotolerans]
MDDHARLWALIEAAWEPLGSEVARARRELAHRTPTPDERLHGVPPLSLVEGALDGFLDNLAGMTRDLPAGELADLDRSVERLLHDIDRAEVHAATDGSDDGFLYARGFIVALGREFYRAVDADPRMAVLDAECEEMAYFFARLHAERFGGYPVTGSGISRESGSNRRGRPPSA